MEIALIIFSALSGSAAMSILAFMAGRCGRKLPVDGMLPRVVHSARFSPEKAGDSRQRNRPNPGSYAPPK